MKAKFINANEFIRLLENYRVANVRGHYGSGKSLLTVALAYEFWRRHIIDRIYSCFPMAGRCEKYEYAERFFMILDEAHVVLDARSFSKNASQSWLKDLRKRESILVLPAVISVDVRFRPVLIHNLLQIGNLLWIYRYQVDDGARAFSGTFALFNPAFYFNSYPTKYVVKDEDFENLIKVMNGEKRYSTQKFTYFESDDIAYSPVIENSYPVDEFEKLQKPLKIPSLKDLIK